MYRQIVSSQICRARPPTGQPKYLRRREYIKTSYLQDDIICPVQIQIFAVGVGRRLLSIPQIYRAKR